MAVTTVLHGCDQAGSTAARPTNAPDGFCYFDTDLNMPIYRDNIDGIWRDALGANPANGKLLISLPGAPVDGTNGTGAGIVSIGAICIDTMNGKAYINTNTTASPLWTVVGAQTT